AKGGSAPRPRGARAPPRGRARSRRPRSRSRRGGPGRSWRPGGEALQQRVGERGPGAHVLGAEALLAEEDGGEGGRRVHPEEGAGLAEMAEGLRGGGRAGPVRVLVVADLESQAPVVGLLAPVAGQDAG